MWNVEKTDSCLKILCFVVAVFGTLFFPPFTEFYIHNFCSILLFAIIVQQSLMLKGSFYMWLLQGFTFDPQSGSTLHIELARANSRTKRSRSG
jgi:hypothetical protein